MRRRDWADNEADRLFDLVRDAEDDEHIMGEIAQALRKAARDFNGERVTGPTGEHPSLLDLP